MIQSEKKPKIYLIQAIRGFLMMGPFFLHYLCVLKNSNINVDLIIPTTGLIASKAVEAFFFISGFILYYIQKENYSPLKFFRRRFVKLLIPYYPITILLFFIWLKFPQLINRSIEGRTDIFASFFLLIPKSGYLHLLLVAWSLAYEVIFIFLFSISLFFKQKFYRFFYLLIIFCITYIVFFNSHISIVNRSINLIFILEFSLGIVISRFFIENNLIKYISNFNVPKKLVQIGDMSYFNFFNNLLHYRNGFHT